MMKELTEEQKKLVVQMADDIGQEIATEQSNLEAKDGEKKEFVPKPNPLVDGILEWAKLMDFDAIQPNSVLLVKVNSDDPEYSHGFQMGVIRHILEPRFKMLKEKKVTVLFMTDKDDISILTEADMAKAGWVRKEPGLIIKPSDL